MRISKKTQYGLRAMAYLANPDVRNEPCPLKKISENQGISFDFLEKIFSELKTAGLIKAKKGIQGGYLLARPAKKIKIGEIIKALEGTMAPVLCIAKEKEKRYSCPRKSKCSAINVWRKIRDTLNSTLNSITLADLV